MTANLSEFRSLPPYPEPRLVTYEPTMPMDQLLERLAPGSTIELTGHVLGSPKSFHINLVTATDDIALHVSVRFDQGKVVFNSRRNGNWEDEKVVEHLPVQQEHNFEAMILVEEMGYKVAFNQQHFAEFNHRLLYSTVEKLRVDGCVLIHRVEQKAPMGFMDTYIADTPPMAVMDEPTIVYNPLVPFVHMLPGGRLAPGLTVYLSGRPHSEANTFFFSFSCGSEEDSDIAFHFSPRLRQKKLVRNSFQDGKWDTEEHKCHGFPFAPGVHFDMLIRVLDTHFEVAVNGVHYIEFQHRLQPLDRVDHFNVGGDVLLACCKFQYRQS